MTEKRVVVEHKHTSDKNDRSRGERARFYGKFALAAAAGTALGIYGASELAKRADADLAQRVAALEATQRIPVECRPVVITKPVEVQFELIGAVPHGDKK